jgi:acyl-CoA synthetase (AMP-forming)/AMP-acid ligase II
MALAAGRSLPRFPRELLSLMSDNTTVLALLSVGAGADAALLAPERPVMTYEALRQHVGDVAHQLNGLGVGRGDGVAIVLPNGPELGASLLAVTAAATAAPLNPAYTADEFAFYFDDLSVVALIVAAGDESVAREVARARGVRILDLVVLPGAAAGKFELRGIAGPRSSVAASPKPTISLSSSIPRAPPRVPRSCR